MEAGCCDFPAQLDMADGRQALKPLASEDWTLLFSGARPCLDVCAGSLNANMGQGRVLLEHRASVEKMFPYD